MEAQNCFYCKKNKPEKELAYKHKLWLVTKRIQFPSPGYEYINEVVEIERCKSCYKKHIGSWTKNILKLCFLAGVWYFIHFNFFNPEDHWLWKYGWSVGITIIGGGALLMFFEWATFEVIYKIPRDVDVEKHPLIKKYLSEGWTMEKPSAVHPDLAQDQASLNSERHLKEGEITLDVNDTVDKIRLFIKEYQAGEVFGTNYEFINEIASECNTKDQALAIIDNYNRKFSGNLLDEMRNMSNSYGVIKSYMSPFINVGIVEQSYPHKQVYPNR